MTKLVTWCLLIGLAAPCLASTQSLSDILASEHRSKENKLRDEYRNPQQTLEFFGLKPEQQVLEVFPGNGWYSEIIAPYIKENGGLTAVIFATDNLESSDKKKVFWSKHALKYKEKMAGNPMFGDMSYTEYDPPESISYADENSIDLALVVRVLHALDEIGQIEAGFNALYRAIKPGGTLGIVQHRADVLSDYSASAVEGYLSESYVIDAAENAGFTLIAKSEINANPNDTKNYPKGVYALPPTYGMGSQERKKYQKIGESDRMTLKFVKPAQ